MAREEKASLVTFADLRIRTKDQRIVPFVPNAVQSKYLDMIGTGWRDGVIDLRGKREFVLKGRQFGFSTLVMALFFLDTINNPETQTKVIAHDTDSTEMLFRMVHRFYDYLPEAKKRPTKYSSKRELVFADNGSFLEVMTAGTKGSGRGDTPSNLHCSEVAFWPDHGLFTGLLQGLPKTGCVFQESTANGEGNEFHKSYEKSVAGDSPFVPRFFAWFEHEEYQTEPVPGFEPDKDEMGLISKYGLSFAQLQWRRDKIKEPGMGNLFRQEYTCLTPDTQIGTRRGIISIKEIILMDSTRN